ncbi:MAG: 2-C-methyl-D-erythritol 4-phosphate cytidylyltransferase [Phycisphaerales bacterium]|nr:2-C-methyl-D-erythritol 4-phosphate cytidylyltransferase [Phycisphaerales bacterium]
MAAPTFSVLLITAPPPLVRSEPHAAAVKIDGREALLRSVELFLNRDAIRQIQLCFLPEFAEEGRRKFGGHLSFSGVKVITGGPRWTDQAAAAMEKLSSEATHVIVHDAARPAVAYDDLDALLTAASRSPVACLSCDLRAAVFELDDGGHPIALREPHRLAQMLMPMSFSKDRFARLARDKQEPHASEFTLIKSSGLNVRVFGGQDAGLVKAMLNLLPKPKVKPPSSPFEEAQW